MHTPANHAGTQESLSLMKMRQELTHASAHQCKDLFYSLTTHQYIRVVGPQLWAHYFFVYYFPIVCIIHLDKIFRF
jgi:hypothetical protein